MMEDRQRPAIMEMGPQSLSLIITPPVLHSTAASTRNTNAFRRSAMESISGFSDPGRVQYGNHTGCPARGRPHLRIQLNPDEAAMLRVWIDAHHGAVKPTLALPI